MPLIYQDEGIIYYIGRRYKVRIYVYDDRIVIEKDMKLTGGGGGLVGIAARAIYKASGRGKETITLNYSDIYYIREARSGLSKVVEISFKNPNTNKIENWKIFKVKNRSKLVSVIQERL